MKKTEERIFYEFMTNISSLGSYTFFAVLILFFLATRQYYSSVFLLVGFILLNLIVGVIRYFVKKDRPDKLPRRNFIENISSSSMPSMHAATSSFLLQTFLFYFGGEFLISVFFVILTILIMYSRVYLRKHFTVDVVVGFIIGLLVFLLLTFIQLKFL